MKLFIAGLVSGALLTFLLTEVIEEIVLRKMLKNVPIDDEKKQQKEEADYYFNEAKKIIESNDNHILHLD